VGQITYATRPGDERLVPGSGTGTPMVIGLVDRRPHVPYVLQLRLYCADRPGATVRGAVTDRPVESTRRLGRTVGSRTVTRC